GTIFEDECTVADGVAVRSYLSAGRSGRTLTFDYRREVCLVGASGSSLFGAVRAVTTASIFGFGVPDEWYRIEIAWYDGVEHVIAVDGSPIGEVAVDSTSALIWISESREVLVVGGDL